MAPRDLAAFMVLILEPGRDKDTAGSTTAILPEAGDRATATAAVAAAETGALHFRGVTPAPANAAAAAAAAEAAAATAGVAPSTSCASGDSSNGDGDGDDEDPATAISRGRNSDLPLFSEVDDASFPFTFPLPLPFPLSTPTPTPGSADATSSSADSEGLGVLFGAAFLRGALPAWPACCEWFGGLAAFFGDLAKRSCRERAAPASFAALTASRSAVFLASTRAAARSTAALGVRFFESTRPLAAPPPGVEPGPAAAEALRSHLSPPPTFLFGDNDDDPLLFAWFLRLVPPAKPPLIQPLRRLNESFTWYLPLRGDDAADAAAVPAAAKRRLAAPALPFFASDTTRRRGDCSSPVAESDGVSTRTAERVSAASRRERRVHYPSAFDRNLLGRRDSGNFGAGIGRPHVRGI